MKLENSYHYLSHWDTCSIVVEQAGLNEFGEEHDLDSLALQSAEESDTSDLLQLQ